MWIMSDHRRKKEDSGFGQNFILEEYRRREKKLMDNSCITGEGTEDSTDKPRQIKGIMRIVSWLPVFSLVLGLLVFLILWLKGVLS